MFSFFQKTSSSGFDFSLLGTDMHSHILPGIDDGSRNLEMSVELVRGMKELGYRKLIATPHVMWDVYKNSSDIILHKLGDLKEKLKQESVDIELEAAAEYFLDDHVVGLVKNNVPLLTIGNKRVLVEFSLANPSLELKDIIFQLQMQSYQPIIAHPERYLYLDRHRDFYDEMKDMGCLFQLNALSLIGSYGKTVQDLGLYLVKKGYYDLIGTDLHHARHLEALRNPALGNHLKKLMDTGKILNASL
jgi:tyrosine-protein phosphatase YwqE